MSATSESESTQIDIPGYNVHNLVHLVRDVQGKLVDIESGETLVANYTLSPNSGRKICIAKRQSTLLEKNALGSSHRDYGYALHSEDFDQAFHSGTTADVQPRLPHNLFSKTPNGSAEPELLQSGDYVYSLQAFPKLDCREGEQAVQSVSVLQGQRFLVTDIITYSDGLPKGGTPLQSVKLVLQLCREEETHRRVR
ncbi:hypothetical protein EST38_g2732 [Candolleomyces aberdarensis]|uniref:Uncharacterized protein n=1 Tax=Candolleomyces aberdarensis TaxID=2316362 RepID=A0A4Q2DTW4_9AGAR|nr:hypothetical protein EST38_g2732 [Candolleomyces aberdarensis]